MQCAKEQPQLQQIKLKSFKLKTQISRFKIQDSIPNQVSRIQELKVQKSKQRQHTKEQSHLSAYQAREFQIQDLRVPNSNLKIRISKLERSKE